MLDYATAKARDLPIPRKGHQRHYCVISDRKGRIVAEGSNLYEKTHTIQARFAERVGKPGAICLHAELHCLIKAKGRGDKLTVVRVGRSGEPRNSKPCAICELAIKESKNIKSVEYTT